MVAVDLRGFQKFLLFQSDFEIFIVQGKDILRRTGIKNNADCRLDHRPKSLIGDDIKIQDAVIDVDAFFRRKAVKRKGIQDKQAVALEPKNAVLRFDAEFNPRDPDSIPKNAENILLLKKYL